MVSVITQLLQVLFAVVALLLGFALSPRSRPAARLCVAGGVVLLIGAGFEILWITIVESVFGSSARPQAIAGAFAAEGIEAVLEGAGWVLLMLGVFAGRPGASRARR